MFGFLIISAQAKRNLRLRQILGSEKSKNMGTYFHTKAVDQRKTYEIFFIGRLNAFGLVMFISMTTRNVIYINYYLNEIKLFKKDYILHQLTR